MMSLKTVFLATAEIYKETIPEALALAGVILKEEENENRKARRKLLLKRIKDFERSVE